MARKWSENKTRQENGLKMAREERMAREKTENKQENGQITVREWAKNDQRKAREWPKNGKSMAGEQPENGLKMARERPEIGPLMT